MLGNLFLSAGWLEHVVRINVWSSSRGTKTNVNDGIRAAGNAAAISRARQGQADRSNLGQLTSLINFEITRPMMRLSRLGNFCVSSSSPHSEKQQVSVDCFIYSLLVGYKLEALCTVIWCKNTF